MAMLHRVTALLCVASLVASLACYLSAQPLPANLLALLTATCLAGLYLLRKPRNVLVMTAQELADRLLKVQESERQRLSRELHDDIGQLLTAAKLQAEWLHRRLPENLQEQCNTLRSTLDDTLVNVRNLATASPRASSTASAWRPACARICCAPWKTPRCAGASNAKAAWTASRKTWPWPPSVSRRKR